MTTEMNPFEAAIAALEAKRAQLVEQIDADIAALKAMAERAGAVLPVTGSSAGVSSKIEKDTFYNMSIAEAAAKFLKMNKKPQATNTIIDALEMGGLRRSAYQTVYSILSRRQKVIGDIVNVNGDWALQEWYGAVKPKPSNNKKKKGDEITAPSWNPDDDVSDEEMKEAIAAADKAHS
jgi:hypothetical protein